MRHTTPAVFLPFFVTMRRTWATWAAPANAIQAGTSTALIDAARLFTRPRTDIKMAPLLRRYHGSYPLSGMMLPCNSIMSDKYCPFPYRASAGFTSRARDSAARYRESPSAQPRPCSGTTPEPHHRRCVLRRRQVPHADHHAVNVVEEP